MSQENLTNKNEVIAAYQEAVEDWRAGSLDKARRETEHIRKFVTDFPKLTLLEAFIARDKREYITELEILRRCLDENKSIGNDDAGLAAEAWSMIGSAFHELGKANKAIEAFSHAVEMEPELSQRRVEASNQIFAANSAENFSSEDFLVLYQRYEALLAPIVPFPPKKSSHARLRVGYLSADFCGHPVGRLILPLLEHHDKNRFEIYCYHAGKKDDDITEKLRASSDAWRNIASASDEEAARWIYDDAIDILVELGIHTQGNRLPVLAYRPAAVQICGIGDVRSSGLSCVDYFLSDVWCAGDEASTREDFAERVIRLPHTHFCFSPPDNLPPLAPPPCLAHGYTTFGSFNNASKITDETLSLWNEILLRVPQSRLLLKHKLFGGEEGLRFTKERMKRLGFDLSRVELRGFSPGHLSEYADMDIALDTYPYTGGMTTFEALSMGVPVVTRYGTRHGTRFGYSILQNLGLGELAASTPRHYVEIAAALAENTELLSTLRENMREFLSSSSPSNAAQYASDIEAAYETVWKEKENDTQ